MLLTKSKCFLVPLQVSQFTNTYIPTVHFGDNDKESAELFASLIIHIFLVLRYLPHTQMGGPG